MTLQQALVIGLLVLAAAGTLFLLGTAIQARYFSGGEYVEHSSSELPVEAPAASSAGKAYTLDPATDGAWADTAGLLLTDGETNATDAGVAGKDVGWQGQNASVVIDLGMNSLVSTVGVYGGIAPTAGDAPFTAQAWTSADGTEWTAFGSITGQTPAGGGWLDIAATPAEGRYVRVSLTRTGTWVLASEVRVQ